MSTFELALHPLTKILLSLLEILRVFAVVIQHHQSDFWPVQQFFINQTGEDLLSRVGVMLCRDTFFYPLLLPSIFVPLSSLKGLKGHSLHKIMGAAERGYLKP